jgi:hypothetical protein
LTNGLKIKPQIEQIKRIRKEMATVTISMDSILYSLGFLSSRNKRWLAKHLMEQADRDEMVSAEKQTDEEFFKDLFSTPYDNPISVEDSKRVIRESRHWGVT